MALLRRYCAYTAVSVFFLYMLYSLSFPYYPPGGDPARQQNGNGNSPQNGEQHKPAGPKRYDWAKVSIQNKIEVDKMTPFPTSAPKSLPKIQATFKEEDATAKNIREKRQEDVKKVFLRSWRSYRSKAWMHDELKPISGGSRDPFGGWAATLVDSLDTLWIMGFKEEFHSAMKDVEKIDFGLIKEGLTEVNIFETTIRHLGGLLSAYELSGEKVLLRKAREVGDMLYHAFDTPNHMPKTRWNPHKKAAGETQNADSRTLLSEIGSLAMEFATLSRHTQDPKYYDAITRVTRVFDANQDRTKLPGMWPIVVNARKTVFSEDTAFSLGSMADSAYEYFAKMYALLGGVDEAAVYKKLYEGSMKTAIEHTLYKPMTPDDSDLLYPGQARAEGGSVNLIPEMQHLACFAGGMFALGGKLFKNDEHVSVGRKITDTCVWAYKASPAGVMPEVSYLHKCPKPSDHTVSHATKCAWDEEAYQQSIKNRGNLEHDEDPSTNIATMRLPIGENKGFTAITDRRYILRPEAIESVFIMYRTTGEQQWAAAAWDMFTSIERHTATEFGNAALGDVSEASPGKMDSMESFWMAETLKYFYLMFSEPGVISLDDYVFNTEAHPFKIPKPEKGEAETKAEFKEENVGIGSG